MIDSHESPLKKATARALVAAIAACSLGVVLDAGAKYSGLAWRSVSLMREPAALDWEAFAFTPQVFRLSPNLPLERTATCLDASDSPAAAASAYGDESLNSGCSTTATVKAVGDFPGPELLSLVGDSLYHRALRF